MSSTRRARLAQLQSASAAVQAEIDQLTAQMTLAQHTPARELPSDLTTDEAMLDAPLSELGIKDALSAKKTMAGVIRSGIAPPGIVLCSPLQRTLQTAVRSQRRLRAAHE